MSLRFPFFIGFTAALLLPLTPPPDGVLPAFDRLAAQPLVVGIHAPNRDWHEPDLALTALGAFGGVKMMSYHPLAMYARLHDFAPTMQFVVRLNTSWNQLPAPEQFVAQHASYLKSLVKLGITPWVEIANEPNLELHPQAQMSFATWYLTTLSLLREQVPQARYGFPGLAQSLRVDDWLDANADAIEQSDWLGVHAYWKNEGEMLDREHGLKLLTIHERFPDKQLIVTEAGNDAYNVSSEERASEYARYTRELARLPYVEGVYYFLISGTDEWSRFFFDQPMALAVRDAATEPMSPLAWLLGARPPQYQPWPTIATVAPPPPPTPTPGIGLVATPTPQPTPTPEGFHRRELLKDRYPTTVITNGVTSDHWVALPPLPPASGQPTTTQGGTGSGVQPAPAGLRTANGYTVTDMSVRLDLAAPEPGAPIAIQFADQDLFALTSGSVHSVSGTDAPNAGSAGASPTASPTAPIASIPTTTPTPGTLTPGTLTMSIVDKSLSRSTSGVAASTPVTNGKNSIGGAIGTGGTGFALVWDGAGWHLQYYRDGRRAVDQALHGIPPVPTTVATDEADPLWWHVELAIEPRSAAAWLWRDGATRPNEPNAVFAPPEAAASDGAELRALYLPSHLLQNVDMDGGTRYW